MTENQINSQSEEYVRRYQVETILEVLEKELNVRKEHIINLYKDCDDLEVIIERLKVGNGKTA